MKSPNVAVGGAGKLLWLLTVLIADNTVAQENRWISSAAGKWEDGAKWSEGIPPNINHNVVIANGAFRPVAFGNVLVDATSATLPGNMVVSNLRVGSGNLLAFGEDVLNLSNAGLNTPLTVLSSALITNHGFVNITGSILTINDGMAIHGGSLTLLSGGVLNVKGNNYPAYDFSINGTLNLNAGSLNFSNFFATGMGIGSSAGGTMTVSGGILRVAGSAFVEVGGQPGSTGNLVITGGVARLEGQFLAIAGKTNSTGSVLLNGGELVTGDTYIGRGGNGRMTISNGLWRANPPNTMLVGQANGSVGTLLIAGGTNIFSGRLAVGSSFNTVAASMIITGGELHITNHLATIYDFAAISNGLWRAKDISVSQTFGAPAPAQLRCAGGSTFVSSSLIVGTPFSCNQTGLVTVTGGNLIITNAAATAVLEIDTGTFKIDGGTVIADTIDLTSPCGRFERTGGTLIYRSAQLLASRDDDSDGLSNGIEQGLGYDPLNPVDGLADDDGDGTSNAQEILAGTSPTNAASQLRFRSILIQGDDVRIRWSTAGGKTNVIQAAPSLGGNTNDFTDLAQIPITGSGDKTNTYVDVDGAKQSPARYYRIKVVR